MATPRSTSTIPSASSTTKASGDRRRRNSRDRRAHSPSRSATRGAAGKATGPDPWVSARSDRVGTGGASSDPGKEPAATLRIGRVRSVPAVISWGTPRTLASPTAPGPARGATISLVAGLGPSVVGQQALVGFQAVGLRRIVVEREPAHAVDPGRSAHDAQRHRQPAGLDRAVDPEVELAVLVVGGDRELEQEQREPPGPGAAAGEEPVQPALELPEVREVGVALAKGGAVGRRRP